MSIHVVVLFLHLFSFIDSFATSDSDAEIDKKTKTKNDNNAKPQTTTNNASDASDVDIVAPHDNGSTCTEKYKRQRDVGR
jgi:hypothetical protein